mmetsp:Transcript_15276/g.36649  ORF Transcript_15276/g.36649 Transcript_15276/m.36649 type:complete len:239 (-) Transcript_15276:692-1408(-)
MIGGNIAMPPLPLDSSRRLTCCCPSCCSRIFRLHVATFHVPHLSAFDSAKIPGAFATSADMAALYVSCTNLSSTQPPGVVSSMCATSPCIDISIGLHPSLNFFFNDCGRSVVLTNCNGRMGASTTSPSSFLTLNSGNPMIQCRHARRRSTDGRSKPSGTSVRRPGSRSLPNVQKPSAPESTLRFVTTFAFMNSSRTSATWAACDLISASIAGMSTGGAIASGACGAPSLASSSSPSSS